MIIDFLQKENLHCLPTFFQKLPQRKWTWASPDSIVRNEIDYDPDDEQKNLQRRVSSEQIQHQQRSQDVRLTNDKINNSDN